MPRKSELTYDTRSWELAAYFLEDEPAWMVLPGKEKRQHTHELAIVIQQSIEGWIEEKRGENWGVPTASSPNDYDTMGT
jgi:hypothetical protein